MLPVSYCRGRQNRKKCGRSLFPFWILYHFGWSFWNNNNNMLVTISYARTGRYLRFSFSYFHICNCMLFPYITAIGFAYFTYARIQFKIIPQTTRESWLSVCKPTLLPITEYSNCSCRVSINNVFRYASILQKKVPATYSMYCMYCYYFV